MTVNDKVEVKTTETSEPTERLPDAAETMPVSTRIRTPWTDACTRFRRNPVGMASAVLVAALFLLAVFGPYITPFDPENHFDYDHLNEGPSAAYWFGVDSLGRDVFSRILAGTRISLFCGFFSVLAGALIGAVLGLLAGYYEGWIDRIVSRVSDVLFAFPGILLAIGIVAVLGGGMLNVVAAVAIFSVPAFARLVRANVLYLKHETYVEAARSIGASDFTILFRHIFPGTDSRLPFDAHRHGHHHGGVALLPRSRGTAAHARVGRDAERSARRPDDGAAHGNLRRARDLPYGARIQSLGRCASRRLRPEVGNQSRVIVRRSEIGRWLPSPSKKDHAAPDGRRRFSFP